MGLSTLSTDIRLPYPASGILPLLCALSSFSLPYHNGGVQYILIILSHLTSKDCKKWMGQTGNPLGILNYAKTELF